jgi:histidinol-phosphate aminotransferase
VITPKPSLLHLHRSARADSSREAYLRLDRNELVPEWNRTVFENIIAELTPTSFSAYPAVGPLYEQLAARLNVTTRQLLLGAGSDWLIRACFDTFCRQGDRVVLAVPTYGMYEVYANLSEAIIDAVPYGPDFAFPFEAVLASLRSGPRLLGLASPNGVLGSAISTADLRTIVRAAREQHTLVVLDEAYLEYSADRSLPLLEEFGNLVLVRTFSKAGGLAGLRVGYAVAQSELISWIAQVRPNVEINQVAVVACGYLLSHPEVVQQHVADTLAGKRLLVEGLRARGMTVIPGEANFVQVKLAEHRAAILDAFRRQNVLVKDQAGSALLDEWTRITVGPPKEMTVVEEIVAAVTTRG